MTNLFGKMEEGFDYKIRRGVYAVIFNIEKNLLLTVRNPEGMYFLPGGGMKKNEAFHCCLIREVLEETGYSIVIGDFIGHAQQYFFSRKNEPFLGDAYFYLAELLEKRHEPIEKDHFLSWIEIEEAQNVLLHDYHRWAVGEVLRRLSISMKTLDN